MGGFATTLLTLSLAMMGFRGVSVQTIFVGDLCFVACIGLLISAQWEMVKGNTFGYTVLSAFGAWSPAEPRRFRLLLPLSCLVDSIDIGLFYGGYGATLIPGFGIIEAYGGLTPEYYNALGFFVLSGIALLNFICMPDYYF